MANAQKMHWYRCWHGMATDPKWLLIARLANVNAGLVLSVWVSLLDHASQQPNRGDLAGFDFESIAFFMGCETAQVQQVVDVMTAKGLIENGRIAKWEDRQVAREDDSRERVQRYRDKKRNVTQCNADVTDVTQCNARGEEMRGEENIYNPLTPLQGESSDTEKPKRPKFTPPTIDEAKAFAVEMKLPATEAEKFFDHYEACGWRVGMKPMKNWQSAMRNWKRNFEAGTYSRGGKPHGATTRGIETIRTGTVAAQTEQWRKQQQFERELAAASNKPAPEPATLGNLLAGVVQ